MMEAHEAGVAAAAKEAGETVAPTHNNVKDLDRRKKAYADLRAADKKDLDEKACALLQCSYPCLPSPCTFLPRVSLIGRTPLSVPYLSTISQGSCMCSTCESCCGDVTSAGR